MKKILAVILVLLTMTGCTFVDYKSLSVDQTLNDALSKDIKLYNNTYDGYKLYIPRGLGIVEKNDYNLQILYKDYVFYLYVDIVSYYHNIVTSFTPDNSKYYSKKVSRNNKSGSLEISEYDGMYYVVYNYNYSKIEALVDKNYLNDALLNMTYILSSVQYNRTVISTLMGENVLNYKEENVDIFKSKGDRNNFLEALEKYDIYEEKEEKDQDILDIDELE